MIIKTDNFFLSLSICTVTHLLKGASEFGFFEFTKVQLLLYIIRMHGVFRTPEECLVGHTIFPSGCHEPLYIYMSFGEGWLKESTTIQALSQEI